jgi:trigger factor
VEVDFDASIAGTPVEGGSSRNHPLIIGGKNFMPGFEEELVGLAAGQTKQFTLTAPTEYYEQSLAGKTIDFSVTVRRVQAVLKPAADDAFARSLGQFTDLAQLRANVHDGLLREKNAAERQRIRLAILDAIISATTVPAPVHLCERELDQMVHRFEHDLRDRGMELSMYLARIKKTQEQLRTEWMPQAERQVRIMLILRALARSQNIAVDQQELESQMNAAITEMVRSGQATEDQVDPERVRTALSERILTEKTLGFLESRCATS